MATIKLNVGGVKYETTKLTLTKYADTMLGRMFGGSLTPVCDKDGNYFIDADGDLFKYVLNYLRTGKVNLPENFTEFTRLEGQADFYQLDGFIKELREARSLNFKPERIFVISGIMDGRWLTQVFGYSSGRYAFLRENKQKYYKSAREFLKMMQLEEFGERIHISGSDLLILRSMENFPDANPRLIDGPADELSVYIYHHKDSKNEDHD